VVSHLARLRRAARGSSPIRFLDFGAGFLDSHPLLPLLPIGVITRYRVASCQREAAGYPEARRRSRFLTPQPRLRTGEASCRLASIKRYQRDFRRGIAGLRLPRYRDDGSMMDG